MKAALYLRVSTAEQTTLNQELELQKYCENNNLDIYKIYKDEGVSGSKTTRPQLDLMLQDMRNKLFDCVVCWKLDRLGRSVQHLLELLAEFQNKNIRLICTDMNIDTATAQGKFFFTIVGAFAELEREMITERIKLGLARRKKQGKPLGRQKGSKDKSKRKRLGYFKRWSENKRAKFKKYSPPKDNNSKGDVLGAANLVNTKDISRKGAKINYPLKNKDYLLYNLQDKSRVNME